MNYVAKKTTSVFAAAALLASCGMAFANDIVFEVGPEDTSAAATRMRVSMKYNAVEQSSAVEFVNVPGLTATATDVEVLLIYRDASGAVVSATPGIFENGCQVVTTRRGVDAICEVAGPAPAQ